MTAGAKRSPRVFATGLAGVLTWWSIAAWLAILAGGRRSIADATDPALSRRNASVDRNETIGLLEARVMALIR